MGRLIEPLRKYFSKKERVTVISDFDKDLYFRVCINEHMGSQIFWYSGYCRDLMKVLDSILTEEMLFVDVGANQGELTCFAAKRCKKVVAFEPIDEFFSKCVCNVSLNGFKNVKLINSGVGEKKGMLPIYTQESVFYDGTTHAGLATLHSFGERRTLLKEVDIVTLDEEFADQKVSVIKIDVEGHELSVLKGAVKIIKRDRPFLLVELATDTLRAAGTSPAEFFDCVISMGYSAGKVMYDGSTRRIGKQDLTDFQNVLFTPVALSNDEY